jgi:bifunctional DNase/RNase
MVEMHLADVRVSLPTNNPVVLLEEVGGGAGQPARTLFIFIGNPEADAIVKAMRGAVPPRPMTHDLFRDALATLGAVVDRVVVTELRMDAEGNGTFYAELHLRVGEQRHVVSARPSDAIALAARMGSPIFVDEAILETEGVLLPDETAEPVEEALVEQFHDFVEGLRPEDFAS